jgi:MFS family permease
MFLAGSGGFSLYISTQMWLNTLASNKRRATVLSALTALLSFGIAAGPLLLTYTGRTGFLPFLVSSLLCSIIFIPFYSRRSTLPERMEEKGIHVLGVIRKALIPVLGGTVSDFIFFSMTSFLVIYGLAHGLSEAQAALLITAMMCGGILVQIPVGWISDHVNRPLMVMICTIIPLICSQLLALSIKDPYAPWVLFTFCSGALSGIYTSSLALLSENFKGKDLMAANSAFAMMNSVGGLSGVVLSGLAMDIWGSEGLTYSIAAICTLYLLMNSIQYTRNIKESREKATINIDPT